MTTCLSETGGYLCAMTYVGREIQPFNVNIMKCRNCGAEMPEGTNFCPACGSSQVVNNGTQTAPGAVVGFILGLLGMCFVWFPLAGLPLSIIGVVISGKGKKKVEMNPSGYTGAGLLTAGQVMGIIGIIISAIYLVILLIGGALLGGSLSSFMDLSELFSSL